MIRNIMLLYVFQAEDGIRDSSVTGVQTCALPIWNVRYTHTHTMLLFDSTCELTFQIGRASCRERVEISVVAVSLKKKQKSAQQSQNLWLSWRRSTRSLVSEYVCVRRLSSRRRHTRFKCDWSSDVCSFFFKQKTAYEIQV